MSEGRGEPVRPGRRAHPRVPADLEASYEDVAGQLFLRTADLSEGGVFLRSEHPPAVGSSAKILLEVPGHPAIHRLSGVVARRQERPLAGFAVAFEASRLPEDTREALRAFVERVTRGE